MGRANGQDWGTFKVAPVTNHVTKPTTNTVKPANKPSQPVHVNTNNNVNNNWTKQNGVFITGGAINLRTGASTNSKVIALLPTNTEIKYYIQPYCEGVCEYSGMMAHGHASDPGRGHRRAKRRRKRT